MSFIQNKTNQYLRQAITDGNMDKARKLLQLKIGKPEINGITDKGGFTMLHCAAIAGDPHIVMMLIQFGADLLPLTDDGYSALDLALWKGNDQAAEILRSHGCIAPIKEPESLNGKRISHLGREGTVVAFIPRTPLKSACLRAIHYVDRENVFISLWSGLDYHILGDDISYTNYSTKRLMNNNTIFNKPPEVHERRELSRTTLETNPVKNIKKIDKNEVKPSLTHTKANGSAVSVASISDQSYSEFFGVDHYTFDNENSGTNSSNMEENDNIDIKHELMNIVELIVPGGPLGVLLNSSIREHAVIQGFTLLPDKRKGVIESSGRIFPGMIIIGINEIETISMSLRQITQILGKLGRKEKILKFACLKKYMKKSSENIKKTNVNDNQIEIIKENQKQISTNIILTNERRDPMKYNTNSTYPNINKEEECIHCSLPTTLHESKDCPYS